MLERERHTIILKLIKDRSIVSVVELAGMLNASEATIRRDINALAEQGAVRRIRGGAESVRPRHEAHLVGMPFAMSQQLCVAEKQAIARAAAKLIAGDESIIIQGGTTTFALVEFLADTDLDILTNSFPIAAKLLETSRNRITLPGGTLFREQNIILSPFDNDAIGNFHAGTMFAGCYGIGRFGIMETDPLIVQAESRLLQRAERLVVMADSRKLRNRSSMIVAGLERISVLITDDGAKPEELEVFRNANIEVIVAPVTARKNNRDSAEDAAR
ncbi:MAG: DeoR/GlpR family DNA-binding transcription regulator [Proteobacteria bacterium]|nr:DeoR/GlpR family DNA-binding transcription regulator [Pseudomonadota bacterium]